MAIAPLVGVPSPSPAGPLVRVTDLEKAFAGQPVLRGVSFELTHGETLGIIGPSGCGKSVLLRCLAALVPFDRGDVEFDGRSLASMSREQARAFHQHVGIVFQGGALFDSLTVEANLAYGLRELFGDTMDEPAIAERVSWALGAVGLRDTSALAIVELSGGMQKRVAIARTIALRPALVLYDEPTAGLDPINAARIARLTARLRRDLGTTSVIASHDIRNVMRVCDRVAFMREGRIVEVGTPAQLAGSSDPEIQTFVHSVPADPTTAEGSPSAATAPQEPGKAA